MIALSKDQFKKMDALHASLAPLLHKHYTEALGHIIDAEVAFVDQTTLGEIIISFNNPCVAYPCHVEPLGGPALIEYNVHVANAFLEQELGHKTEAALTPEEAAVMAKVHARDVQDTQTVWQSLEPITISDVELVTDKEAILPELIRNNPCILVAFEINGQHFSGLTYWVYPNCTLESVLPKLDAWSPAK